MTSNRTCRYSSLYLPLLGLAILWGSLVLGSAAKAQPPLIAAEEQAFRAAVDFVADSVVQVELFGGADVVGNALSGIGPVSGTVVGADGWIITSNYILRQNPASILVVLSDGKRKAAKLVAEDKHRELALLKIDVDQPLTPVTVAPLDEIEIGYWAIAVGKTFDPATASQSVGILSAKGRVWGRAVQTDAKVSPHNYGGPLIDIQGRVIGILAPLTDDDGTDGMEWYDSGIGFAVPMQQVIDRLEIMQQGKNILPGRIGISTTARDTFSGPLKVALSAANSPAAKAGIKRNDLLLEINDQKLDILRDMKMALGPLDAGQQVNVKINRDGKILDLTCELAAEIPLYQPPYLGIIPGQPDPSGVVIAAVLAGTPAAEAGLKAGDQIARVAEQDTWNAPDLREALSAIAPGAPLQLTISRADEGGTAEARPEENITVTLQRWPSDIPKALPTIDVQTGKVVAADNAEEKDATNAELAAKEDNREEKNSDEKNIDEKNSGGGVVELPLGDAANKSFAYVPPSYKADMPHGVIIYLPEAGEVDQKQIIDTWDQFCREHRWIFAVVSSADPGKWSLEEAELVVRTLTRLQGTYSIDPNRVVVGGLKAGASLALMGGLNARSRFSGIFAVYPSINGSPRLPAAQPMESPRILMVSDIAELESVRKTLDETGYVASRHETGPSSDGKLTAAAQAALQMWLRGLERL